MLLMIDNYDSFTYNLVYYFQCLGQEVKVFQHDRITPAEIDQLAPQYIVISPGPKSPEQAGISLAAIRHCYQRYPILGVCLGHQCIAHALGATITHAPKILHGKASCITHQQKNLFRGLPNPLNVARYHSLAIQTATLPAALAIDAWAKDGTIMAISHRKYRLYGVQFHPEAVLTEHGMDMLANFLSTGSN